jgi:hypothetical protein
MKPEIYGRSTLENSSFIASSVNPDEEVHGRGFVARMSGSTAEMLSMWFLMMAGKDVFTFENGELKFELKPVLPDWMFDSNGIVSFKFLGNIMVNYINPTRKNTFSEEAAKPARYILKANDSDKLDINQSFVKGAIAEDIRNCKIDSIDVYLE